MKSKRKGKLVFFVVFVLILALTYTAFFGIDTYYGDNRITYVKNAADDIRWGIDINGGVEAVFSPGKSDTAITTDDMDATKSIIETRLVNKNITDYEIYTDKNNNQVIVRFPAKNEAGDEINATATVQELGASAMLVFLKGSTWSDNKSDVVLTGAQDVKEAAAVYDQNTNEPMVSLELTASGKSKFATATSSMVGQTISIWLVTSTPELDENGNAVLDDKGEPVIAEDQILLSAPTVQEAITNGKCTITGKFTGEEVTKLAQQINSGKLPFSLNVTKIQIVSPTLGKGALEIMVIAGAIAFGFVCLLMILRYRLNGVVASIALLGQLAGSIACISGYFSSIDSFTLTIPGIAGIILSIGVGVDCNVIAAERIRDEFAKGKTIDGAIESGYKNSLSAIIDGNVTIVIVSFVLMGAFGSPDSLMAKVLSPVMSFFGSAITGSIYSFGYTLLIGTIFNLIMGVLASRAMLKSISKYKLCRKPWLYGGKKNA